MPVMAQRRNSNLGEFAEDATVVTDDTKGKRPLFIEANTVEATLQHLRDDCIIPVFAKDNEATLSHVSFIETVQDAAHTFFNGERIGQPDIRVSHVIKVVFQKQYISLPISYWRVTRPFITSVALS